jgi:hypothetical protein
MADGAALLGHGPDSAVDVFGPVGRASHKCHCAHERHVVNKSLLACLRSGRIAGTAQGHRTIPARPQARRRCPVYVLIWV